MLIELEGIRYYDEEVGCETTVLNDEIKIKPLEVSIDNVNHEVTFKIEDLLNSKDTCDIRITAECKDLSLRAQSDTIDPQEILKDIYQSIIDNKEIEMSDFFNKLKNEALSKLFKDLAKESLIEKVFYKNMVILKVNGDAIGTSIGFVLEKGKTTLFDIDSIIDIEDNQIIKAESFISPNKKVSLILTKEKENQFKTDDITFIEEAVDEKLLNQKQLKDFNDREEYMEYRRSLIAKDLTENLYEMDFDDFI